MLFGISAKITIRQDTRVGCRQGHFMEFRVIQIFNSDLVGLHILILCYGYSALLLFHSGRFLFMKTIYISIGFEKIIFRKLKKCPSLLLNVIVYRLVLQINLCQKPLFLHQLTHNMTRDCSLNSPKNASSQHVVYKYCFECLKKKTIFVHNML